MSATAVVLIVVLLALIGLGLAIRIVKQYEKGVLLRLGRLRGSLRAGPADHHSPGRRAA